MKITEKYLLTCLSFIFAFYSIQIYSQNLPSYGERALLAQAMPANENGLPVSENLLLISKNISEPDEYILGAGDRLFISIRGVDEQNIDVIITPEGTVFIPGVGVVQLRDLSLSDGKDKLKDEISNNFKDVEVDISILDVKIINVNLIGDVIKPSSQNVPAVARLNDLVSTSAGLNVTADLRDIIIIDKNGVSRSYDLLKYYRYGDKSNNPYLTDASIVKIKKADKIISIYGAVPNFGFYEFKEDEYADELIELAGGITDHGREDSIEVISFMDDNKTLTSRYFNLKELITSKVKLKVGDKIVVREKPEYLTDRLVTVKGFIKSPGVYKIQKGVTTLKDVLLNEAGGFLEDASLKDSYIIRSTGENENEDPEFERLKLIPIADMTEDEYDYFKAKAREKKGRMIVDFEKLFIDNKVSENIILKKGDNIVIPEAKNYISIVGQVVNPGNIIYKENFSVDNYIETAGGFSWRAIESDVRIIKANTGEWVEADDVEKLEPGDIIWVPEELPAPRFWDVFIDALTIVGQVATVVAAVVAVVIASRN